MITTSYCSKTSLSFFSSFKTVYTVVKSVQQPSIIGEYPNLHNCRTAGFKIVWYPPRPATCCMFCRKCHLELGRVAASKDTPKLNPCTDIKRELCCHHLGVIFHIYTTKNERILPKTTIPLSHDRKEVSVSSQHAKCTFLIINSYLLLQRYFT